MREGTIDIAVGLNSESKKWKNKKWTWEEFTDRLKQSVRVNTTIKEYLRASKEEQGKIKDVGGYVGGYLRQGRRNKDSIGHRQLLTLDIDFATSDFFFDFEMLFSCCAFMHATHKHTPSEPRFRLLIPLDREASPDEYVAIARWVAGQLNIELFDGTTFQPNRFMYWPSNPRDVEYYWVEQKGEFLSADWVLEQYTDWTDSSLWPTADSQLNAVGDMANRQEDPAMKKGVVGAFCRTYGIVEAIDKFLPEVYTEAGQDRYTFVGGSTSGGVMVYENIWAYSHHGTDPVSGRLCNSFDLVRLHLFGHTDTDSREQTSFKRMEELCTEDKGVKFTIAKEKTNKSDSLEPIDWMTELEIDSRGNFFSSALNLNLIFQHDSVLKDMFSYNQFDNKRYIEHSPPWRNIDAPEPIRNVDYSGVRNYIERTYGIASSAKIDDSMALEIERHSTHPIKEYLTSLEWDGQDRLKNALTDYFGADNTSYTQDAFRKMMVASVSRVFDPGCKFDYMLVLVGSQGIKKSTFLNTLGKGKWFSDSFTTFQGKEAFEQLQGAWLIEIAELSAFRKSEVEAIKQFVSKQKDDFRPAYARSTETFYRQCVFFGTTNNMEFLKDPTGNRRFWPILCEQNTIRKNTTTDLPDEVDQMWAQAVHLYNSGEKLYLEKDVEAKAREIQDLHSEKDERLGMVLDYLERLLPDNWEDLDLYERRNWLENPANKGTVLRDRVCTAEVWCECLQKDKDGMSRYNTREVNDMLRGLQGWKTVVSTARFGFYGKQKYYERELH